MAATATAKAVVPAVVERARGGQPSRLRSLVTAASVGVAAAVLTYRLLCSVPAGGPADEK
jgi:hypothetical protein